MYLLSLILGVLLLPEVSASDLLCHSCIGKTCSEKPCPGQRCASMHMVNYIGDTKQNENHVRGCVPPQQCIQGSINFGVSRTVLGIKCCDADLCNSQDFDLGNVSLATNGKKCFYCDGQQCTKTLNCLGDEDRCISVRMESLGAPIQLKGCVSNDICSTIDMPELSAILGNNIQCCQGDFCNSASSTSAGLLLLVGPIVSFLLFS